MHTQKYANAVERLVFDFLVVDDTEQTPEARLLVWTRAMDSLVSLVFLLLVLLAVSLQLCVVQASGRGWFVAEAFSWAPETRPVQEADKRGPDAIADAGAGATDGGDAAAEPAQGGCRLVPFMQLIDFLAPPASDETVAAVKHNADGSVQLRLISDVYPFSHSTLEILLNALQLSLWNYGLCELQEVRSPAAAVVIGFGALVSWLRGFGVRGFGRLGAWAAVGRFGAGGAG